MDHVAGRPYQTLEAATHNATADRSTALVSQFPQSEGSAQSTASGRVRNGSDVSVRPSAHSRLVLVTASARRRIPAKCCSRILGTARIAQPCADNPLKNDGSAGRNNFELDCVLSIS